MYRVIEKINGNSTFYVQKKYGIFLLKILSRYGHLTFSSIFFGVISIIFFICNMKFSNGFEIGMIPLVIGLFIFIFSSLFENDYRIFMKFDNLKDSKDYIEIIENYKKNKIESKTLVHYMNESEERAEKLRKIRRKKIFI